MQSLAVKVIFFIAFCTSLFCSQSSLASSLSGRVWLDFNENGLEDPVESGIGEIQLVLLSRESAILDRVVAQNTGDYRFDHLPDSDYMVCLQPGSEIQYKTTWYQIDGFPRIDNDALPVTGCTELFSKNNSTLDITDIDFGLVVSDIFAMPILNPKITFDSAITSTTSPITTSSVPGENSAAELENTVPDNLDNSNIQISPPPDVSSSLVSSLSGRVWLDINLDGRNDANEPGVADVPVTLFDVTMTMLDQTVTSDAGEYVFTGLPYSDYIICLREGKSPALDQITGYKTTGYEDDNDARAENGCTVPIRIDEYTHDLNLTHFDLGLKGVAEVEPEVALDQSTTEVTTAPESTPTTSDELPETSNELSVTSDELSIATDELPVDSVDITPDASLSPPISNTGNSSITAIIDGLELGYWAAVPGSQLDFLRACPSATDIDQQHAYLAKPNYKWNFYCAGVINAENGAAFDVIRNRMVVWGGGHADYAGNEVYAFNLDGANPGWEHLNLPSPLPDNCDMRGGRHCSGQGSVEYLIKSPDEPDRLVPSSRHTLDTLEFLPDMGEQGSLWAYSGAVWQGGFVSSAVWTFDTVLHDWTEHRRWDGSLPDPNPDILARPENILHGLEVFSVYDPTTGMIYAHGDRRLQQFDPETQEWTLLTDDSNVSNTSVHSTAAYDYEHKKLVVIGGSSDFPINPSWYEITGAGSTKKAIFHDLDAIGDTEIMFADGPGIAYEPDADVFVAWSGGRSVYVLDMQVSPPRWEKVLLEGDDPGNAARMGTFGRLRYVPDKKVMMLVNRIVLEDDGFTLIKNQQQANVFFFRLPSRFYKNGNAPEPIIAATPETGETVGFQNQTIKHLYPFGSITDAVNELIPGDTLIIHEGEYLFEKFVEITAQGTAEAPVIITSAEGEARPLISTKVSIGQNTFNIAGNASYITIKGLEITNGNHEDAVKLYGNHISHITLENLHIHDVSIGVRVATDADHILIRNNHIHDTGQIRLDEFGSFRDTATGEGMYLGCHRGRCSLADSIIENNLIHDTSPDAEQGDGIEMKTRSHDNIIRNNVVYNMGSKKNPGYGGILVWGWSQADDTADWSDNIVDGNVIWGNNASLQDVGIEAISHAVVKNNIVFNVNTGLASNPEFRGGPFLNIPVRDVEFVNNTVYQATIGGRLIWHDAENVVFANNIVHTAGTDGYAVSCRTFIQGELARNVVQGKFLCEEPGAGFIETVNLADQFVDVNQMNFWPRPDAVSLIGQGLAEYAPAIDFNGSERITPVDIGAYQTNGSPENPGWAIQSGQFKK